MINKVKIHQSIGIKIIIVYILLLLFAVQVIGAYFANRLESELKTNFIESINDRVELLTLQIQQEMTRERTEEDPTLQQQIGSILTDYDLNDINELQVYDKMGKILGTANQFKQDMVGKITNNDDVDRVIAFGWEPQPEIKLNKENGHRTLVRLFPIYDPTTQKTTNKMPIGAIYLEASVEEVYNQLQEISRIFTQGTILSMLVTVVLGILVARAITNPIAAMRRQAHVMAGGDFSKRVNVYSTDEIGQLAMAFNHLNDKLKQSYATTEGERRKLTSVLSNMNEGVIATDREGNIILMNEPAMGLVGMSFDQAKGKSLLELLGIADQVADIEEFQQIGSMIIDFSDENQHLLMRATFSVISDDEEEVNGYIVVLSDVTEEEKIERERREFVANVSHELRTPLTTMRSYLEALTDGETWRDPNIAPKFLKVTQTETERMIRLVNDLLQLSKMDNKDYMLNKEKVNFTKFFHHIIDRFELGRLENLVFVRKLPDEPIWLWLDKDKMTQVLDNVISNAIKYSPEGGKIIFETIIKRKQLIIKISDEGVGIPADQVDRIFDRFYRVDKARSRKLGGTGLGLAIAKEMVQAHNGEIRAESTEGKGTTIIITLPFTQKKRGDAS
jgi:two-component system, OmpR family, sensor histidine kinase VicK